MSIGKSPRNDRLSVEFFKCFWDDIKTVFFSSVCYSRTVGELSSSQRQAIIKLIEKKDKDKRYIENWRPISLLNIDTKIISKSLASRFIPVLATIISSDQTAYVKGRYIGEGCSLMSWRLLTDITFQDSYSLLISKRLSTQLITVFSLHVWKSLGSVMTL